jgi:hypothetical protein
LTGLSTCRTEKMTKKAIKRALNPVLGLFKKKDQVIHIEVFNDLKKKGIVLVK